MATLVSPGVSVTLTDESFYASANAGTVPLVILATAANKLQSGSTTNIAPGTLAANAGALYSLTSQRDALQTFGTPTYYQSGGSEQYGNELNEHGLLALYQYLGINNTAYAIRANIDTSQLIPSATAPTGTASNGSYWLDTSNSTYGVFRSNGNTNPAFAWKSYAPTVITSLSNLENFVQMNFSSVVTSGSQTVISVGGTLSINGNSITVSTTDTITSIANYINSNTQLALLGITAKIFAITGKYSATASSYGDIYSLRIVAPATRTISMSGTTGSVLTDLGLTSATPRNITAPSSSLGNSGDYAVDTVSVNTFGGDTSPSNQLWEKITIVTNLNTTSWWFKVGSTNASYTGYGWNEAVPTVITGTVANPTFTASDSFYIQIGSGSLLTVTIPATPTLATVVAAINTQLNSGSGTNAVASIYTVGSNNYLRITNYSGTNIYLKDIDDQTYTHHPLRAAGIFATQTYFGSVTGTVANPTYVAATLLTSSAAVVAAGTGYAVGDTLTVVGGTSSVASTLTVASLKVVSVAITGGTSGSGFVVNDTITFSGAGYTLPVILKVQGISGGAVSNVSIVQAGQYTGTVPGNPVSFTSTSGAGTGATFSLTWGVNAVNVGVAGNYTVYPSTTVTVTGGTGTGATFALTSGFLTSNTFTINAGSGPVTVHVPASPNATLTGVVNAINAAFPSGPIVASAVSNQLVITNSNGTGFTLQDISGTPLNSSGIPVGIVYGRAVTYQGYSPSLTVPSALSALAVNNVWINTTPANNGANYVLKEYINGTWTPLNTSPATGTIPMYSSDSVANAAFGAGKAIGSVYVRYNSQATTPAIAEQVLVKWNGSSWAQFTYTPSASAPSGPPAAGTYWFNSNLIADIMVSNGTIWKGYRNVYPATDVNGVILSGSAPVTQSTGAALVDYDLWIDTSNTTSYPALYRYSAATATWVTVNTDDQVTSAGIIFADARNNADGTQTGSTLTKDMVLSDYVDPDAPNALLYPSGMLLFDTRFSTNNVKVWSPGYLPATYNNQAVPYRDRWVTASGNAPNGTPYMGRYAQRIMVVNALNAVITANQAIRAEQNYFNLIACPGYPETISEMVTLNTDIKQVAFVIGDPPARLPADGTSIQNWATNVNDAAYTNDIGLTVADDYTSIHYPWGLTTNIDGNQVFAPASVAALTTFAYNDQVSYPWFAPAGFNRGVVTVFNSVGYLDSSGNYVPTVLNQGQRDVLYSNNINPIAYIPNKGLIIYGQKTLSTATTALDRINVARLINYLNYNLDNIAKPFLFEPNDTQTRQAVTATFTGFMSNLVGLRGLYDFAVVCDATNNTPDRIDQNQLWIDVAIKPTKDIEFIYIPIRLLSTADPLPGGTK